MAYVNLTDLVQNDTDDYVVTLNRRKNVTLGISTGASNHAAAAVRLDATWGDDIWKTGISLSDPSAALGAAFVNSLTGASQVANTQDRVFGAEKVRVVRTDGNGGTCKVYLSERLNG